MWFNQPYIHRLTFALYAVQVSPNLFANMRSSTITNLLSINIAKTGMTKKGVKELNNIANPKSI